MVEAGEIVGITTNPKIFAKSISVGADCEAQMKDLALRGAAVGEALRLITGSDVRAASDVLLPAHDASRHRDGEVDPRISGDAERTAVEVGGLWWLIDRPNLFIKIPATQAALPAITAAIADAISVKVTLIFSIERYRAVLDAFMTGMEQRVNKRHSLAGIESVASFFVSRVDTEVDRRLKEMSGDDDDSLTVLDRLHGQVALANARLAYKVYEQTAASDRWQALAAQGGSLQRLLWASTGVNDKGLPATHYVTELVAHHTVNTMPEATLRVVAAYAGPPPDTITGSYDDARGIIDSLARAGVDLDDIAFTLEREGIASFEKSWNELIASVEKQLENAGGDVMTDGAVSSAGGEELKPAAPAAGGPATSAAKDHVER